MSIDQVDTQDVFVPTDKGSDELKAGSTRLSPAALKLLVLFDGKLNLGEVLARAGQLPGATAEADARRTAQMLASDGYVELAQGVMEINIDFSYFFGTQPDAPSASAVALAGAEAEAGARTLSLDGYYVSIARRAADKARLEDAPPATVLVVEDDPEMQRMLRFLLTEAGFSTRAAGNRAEIVVALRTLPFPRCRAARRDPAGCQRLRHPCTHPAAPGAEGHSRDHTHREGDPRRRVARAGRRRRRLHHQTLRSRHAPARRACRARPSLNRPRQSPASQALRSRFFAPILLARLQAAVRGAAALPLPAMHGIDAPF